MGSRIIASVLCWVLLLLTTAARARSTSDTQPSASTQPAQEPQSLQMPAPDYTTDLTGDWSGARTRLYNAGIDVGAKLFLEGFYNLQGGVSTSHPVGATTFDLDLTFDLAKLANINGGTIFLDLEDHAFRNPSRSLVGDLQDFDFNNTPPYLVFAEAWYQQMLFNDKLRIKIGKIDANGVTEFSVIDNGVSFLNGSAQSSPTIFNMPTTPYQMPGIDAFFTPADWYYAGVGVFYANQSDRFGELIDDPASEEYTRFGSFIIGETGFRWHGTQFLPYAGNFKIGGWGQTGTFEKFDGNPQRGTEGMYTIYDQTLYQPSGEPENGRGIRAFADYGLTQRDIYAIDQHVGAGFTDTGADVASPRDVVGIGAQYAQISSEARLRYPFELSIEGFDRIQITPWSSLQPDIQYILHPGGEFKDAVVTTLRCEIDF
jgi:porin